VTLKQLHSIPQKSSGFTLLELMVAIAIVAILAAVAFGSLNTLVPRYQVKSAAQDLRSDLQRVKMEAVKSNQEALITFDKADAGSQGGYTTCINNDGNQICDEAQGDVILAQKTFTANNYKHALLKNPGFTNGEHFKFNSRGIPVQDDGSYFSSGSVEIENGKDSNYTLSITVSPSGRIRID